MLRNDIVGALEQHDAMAAHAASDPRQVDHPAFVPEAGDGADGRRAPGK